MDVLGQVKVKITIVKDRGKECYVRDKGARAEERAEGTMIKPVPTVYRVERDVSADFSCLMWPVHDSS